MANFQKKSAELFKNGYSCSEAVVRAAYECGLINPNIDISLLNSMASSFSGGMGGSGCACGAVTGAQMVLGLILGKKEINCDPHNIRKLSGKLIERFKDKRKVTCCRALTSQFKDNPSGRRPYCAGIVEDAAEILDGILNENLAVK